MARAKEESKLPAPCVLWPVELKLTQCSPDQTLLHFQGQYMTICDLDYNILQVEIENAEMSSVSVQVGDVCLVEKATSGRWYRGRVQDIQNDSFHVFLIDHGDVLVVGPNHLASISDTLLMLPPKIVCGFFANILPVQKQWDSLTRSYFSSLIGSRIKGYIHARLPYHSLILEVPDINADMIKKGLGKHVDTNTFLQLVEMLIGEPIPHSNESVPDLLIEKQIGQECCLKSSSLLGFEEILSLNGPKLKVGQSVKVVIAAAVKPGLFYCRLSSMGKDLQEMSDKLAQACELSRGSLSCQPLENLGLLCAVKGKDEKWHRGLVECLPLNSQVRVVFVDSGYCESVKVENIINLPSEFLSKPIMAFPCSLTCLEGQDETVKSQQLDALKTGLMGQALEIEVDDFRKDQNLYLVTLSTAEKHSEEPAKLKQLESRVFESKSSFPNNVLSKVCATEAVQSSDSGRSETVAGSSFFEGYVVHVQNPHHFWIRTKDQNSDFEIMMKELTEHFSKVQLNEEVLEDPVPGALCCAMYVKDFQYYRALVVDTLEHGAEVCFIDFGNIEKVPSNLIKKLPRKFAIHPKFKLECSLANVAPFDDLWTTAASNFFREITENKTLMVHVIHRKNDKYFVDLFEREAEESRSIATMMTEGKMALDWRYNPLASVVVERLHKEIKGKGNMKKKQKWKNPQVVTFEKIVSSSHNPNLLTPEWELKDNDTLTETPKPKIASLGKFKPLIFKPGSEISVICSHVNSPSDFWCQREKTKVDLDRLMEDMQVFYKTNTVALESPAVCCAVKSSQNNRWYRACILGGNGKEMYVVLVDFGIMIQEKMQNIQALVPQFFELHEQAFRCSLDLIEPIEGSSWSSEACALFRDFMSKRTASTCTFHSQLYEQGKGLLNVVRIHTPDQQPTAYLVEKGVAMEIQNPKLLKSLAYPYSFVYSSFNLSSGSEELVHVTHVGSPWEIYIQLERNVEVMEGLMDRVAEESQRFTATSDGCCGNVCLAKYFGDGSWYRALTRPVQSHQHLSVFFVDYGDRQFSEKTNVMAIPITAVDLLLTPMQALRCSLLEAPEGEPVPEVNEWLESNILDKSFQARFVLKDNSGHFVCELYDGGVNVNEKLQELIAEHDCVVSKPASDFPKEAGASPLRSEGNAKARRRRQPKQASEQTSHPPKGEHKTPKKEECRVAPSSPEVVPSQQSLPNINDLPAGKMKPGHRGVGFVSHCNSVESFFIQMEDDEPSILQLGEELNCSDFKDNMRKVASVVKVGDLVAAEYEEDLALYRALVTNVSNDGHLAVEFIDYGNTTTVDKRNVHMLSNAFLSQPRLSVPCTLAKPHSFANDESFDKKVAGIPLIVEFIQKVENHWEVCVETEYDHIYGDVKHDIFQSNDLDLTRQETLAEEPQRATQADSHSQTQEEETIPQKTQQDETIPQMTNSHAQHCECERGNTQTEVTTVEQNTTSVVQQCKSEERNSQAGVRTSRQKTNSNIKQHKTELRNRPTVATKAFKKALTFIPKCAKPGEFWSRSYKKTQYKPKVAVRSKPLSETSISAAEDSRLLQEKACTLKTKDNKLFKSSVSAAEPSVKDSGAETSLEDISPGKVSSSASWVRSQPLLHAPVRMNSEYKGFAAAVTTPFEFYLILEDLLLIVDAISSILENLPEELPPLPDALLLPGASCLMKSRENSKWCRAEIVRCDALSVLVNLVDYGQYRVVSRRDGDASCRLTELPEELAGLPRVTYHCLLRGVRPAAPDWTDHAIVFFQKRMCAHPLRVRFRQRVSRTQWEVDITAGDCSLAKALADAGHAAYIDQMMGIRFGQESAGEDASLAKSSQDAGEDASPERRSFGKTAALGSAAGSKHCSVM